MQRLATNASVDSDASHREQLELLAIALVGREDLDRTRLRLCRAMLREALRRTCGNYTRAARLLGVKRQAVQQMVHRMDLKEWAERLKGAGSSNGPRAQVSPIAETAQRVKWS